MNEEEYTLKLRGRQILGIVTALSILGHSSHHKNIKGIATLAEQFTDAAREAGVREDLMVPLMPLNTVE